MNIMSSPEYMDSPELDRNPSPPPEFAEHPEILQAENIGNTVFSKHWLFTTLIKLIEEVDREKDEESNLVVDVDEDLQNELCKLWDMSMNSDVAKFLNEFKGVEILSGIIEKSKAPRVIEIAVGILGNMACEQTVCKQMSENHEFIDLVILLMETRDVPTLVETTRLISTSLSNTGSRGPWIRAIQRSEEILGHLKFIFSSSTNCDLLKNTAGFVDTLLDLESDLCVSWATIDFIHSLLEATEQIGSNHGEALEVYLHIFHSFSTTESGVEALVLTGCARHALILFDIDGYTSIIQTCKLVAPEIEPVKEGQQCVFCHSKTDYKVEVVKLSVAHIEKLEKKIIKYLSIVCEYEIVGLDGKDGPLASALSVFNILLISQPEKLGHLCRDEKVIRILLKILEPLYPMIQKYREAFQTSPTESIKIKEKVPAATSNEQSDSTIEMDSGNNPIDTKEVTENSENGSKEAAVDGSEETEFRQLEVLYEILSTFIVDYCNIALMDSCEENQEKNKEVESAEYSEDSRNNIQVVLGSSKDGPRGDNSNELVSSTEDENELQHSKDVNQHENIDKEIIVESESKATVDCVPILTYLDETCSRWRINNFGLCLKESDMGSKLYDRLCDLAEKSKKERLCRILTDISAGKIVTRADSSKELQEVKAS